MFELLLLGFFLTGVGTGAISIILGLEKTKLYFALAMLLLFCSAIGIALSKGNISIPQKAQEISVLEIGNYQVMTRWTEGNGQKIVVLVKGKSIGVRYIIVRTSDTTFPEFVEVVKTSSGKKLQPRRPPE